MRNKLVLLSLLIVASLASCSKDDNNQIPSGQGAVNVALTDAPFPFTFVNEANVGLSKIELRNEQGEYFTVFEGSSSHNMVNLNNGVSADISTQNLPIGVYTQARITMNEASVLLSDGSNFNMNADATAGTYSTSISPSLQVEEGTNSNVLFDLNINESFSFFGFGGLPLPSWITSHPMIGGCNFEPEFRVCDLDQTGSLNGRVSVGGNHEANVAVTMTVDGKELATRTKADGTFTFIGVSPGNYSIHASHENGGTGQANNVSVSVSNTSSCNISIN